MNSTKYGLWYDEAVEFYYSKYITGPVPGGVGTTNMLERIQFTFQPPLYNVLMFFWLTLFDSELAFRIAGILITLIGSIGVFLAIDEIIPNGIWSNLGTFFYLFTYGIVYYALECAEYNLMLCFLAWSAYFYFRVQHKNDFKSIVCFFGFACLSLYSQYGSAFIILGMVMSLFLNLLVNRNYARLKKFFVTGIIVTLALIVPLIIFFVIPQMKHQGSAAVSHSAYYARGLVADFLWGIKDVMESLFGQHTVYGALFLTAISFTVTFIRFRKMIYTALALLIAWLAYFFAVCCSFYGYNMTWNRDSVGSMNLGGKYSYFFIPLLVVFLTICLGMITDYLKCQHIVIGKLITFMIILCFSLFGIFEVYRTIYLRPRKPDDDVRELTLIWYEMELYDSKTLLFQWDDALFNFYLTHDERYLESYSDSIEAADLWIRTADYKEMHDKLDEMGYLSIDDFYYVTSNTKDNPNFLAVMTDAGYEYEYIYSGGSILLHLTK
jgi:hypothetical protein